MVPYADALTRLCVGDQEYVQWEPKVGGGSFAVTTVLTAGLHSNLC